ncbi:DnaJ family molecular chaperone [Phenylobacterium sp.]|uniref:DnaJ family molecular chaperone n=1 Tax=Phenylobacterium sp. TaxID=1871053 RepID=UPI002CB82741|nr:DnaJ family molecular chaperone [Phenylobacterium sp.]HLZ75720.1 DnaJ family molecular chaperone [Phenylobacterium sp.]
MSFWRKIAGLAARNLDEAECDVCPPGLPGEDPAFSTAVTALGAKLAKADGQARSSEWLAFSEVFQSDEASEGNVRRLYQLAQQTTRGFEGYARRLQKRYHACPQLLEDVVDGLFHIAQSDGVVTGDELAYLERVSQLFGQSPLVFRRLKATHLGPEAGDPYAVLGVRHDCSDAELRAARRAMLSEAHPDRARARGLPAEFVEVAEIKAGAINAAFDAAMRERRALSLQGVA